MQNVVDIQQSFFYAQQGDGRTFGVSNVNWFMYGVKHNLKLRPKAICSEDGTITNYDAIMSWLTANGYKADSASMDCILNDEDLDDLEDIEAEYYSCREADERDLY